MNVWKDETHKWDAYRRHTLVCPQCHAGPMCAEGLRLEKLWGDAYEMTIRAEKSAEYEMEMDLANEVALPPDWVDDHAGDWRPGMQEP